MLPGIGMEVAGVGNTFMGGILGQMGASQQQSYNQQTMKQQFEYNKQMADINQQHNKEMYDYTNYENQVKHMRNAGLNPALLYGMGGSGGSSTAGGQGQGISAVGGNEVQSGAAISGMALQAGMMQSQIALNEANAKKAEADANKTAGVDTEVATEEKKLKKALAALTEYQATTESEGHNLMVAKIQNVIASTNKLNAETAGAEADAEVAERTINTRVQQSFQAVNESLAKQFEMKTQGRVNQQTVKYLQELIEQNGKRITLERRRLEQTGWSVELEAERLYKEFAKSDRQMDQQDERLAQEWIFGGIKAATDLGLGVGKLKALKKIADKESPKNVDDTYWTEDDGTRRHVGHKW